MCSVFFLTLRAIDKQISTVQTTWVSAHASPSNGKKGIKKSKCKKKGAGNIIIFKTCRAGRSATGEIKFYRYPVLPVFRGTVTFDMTRFQRVREKKVLGKKKKCLGAHSRGKQKEG